MFSNQNRPENVLSKKRIIAIALGFFVLNFLFRCIHLDYGSYFLDEAANLWYYQQGPSAVIARSLNDVNPPVYGLLICGWIKAFGISEFSTRLFSVLVLALAGYILFILSYRISGLRAALISSVLFLLSDYLFFYSHAARPYALLCFEIICSYYVFYNYIKSPKFWLWLCLLIMNVLLLFTHPTTVFQLMTQGILVIIFINRQAKLFGLMCFNLCMSIGIYYIWYLLSPAFDKPAITWLELPDLHNLNYILIRLFGGVWFSIGIIVSFLLLFLIARHKKTEQIDFTLHGWFLLAWSFLPIVLNAFFSFITGISVFSPQYLITCVPGFYILIGILVSQLLKSQVFMGYVTIVSLIIWHVWILNLYPSFHEDWRKTAEIIREKKTTETAVFLSPQYQHRSLTYYYERAYYENYDSTFLLMNNSNIFFEKSTPIDDILSDSSIEKLLFVLVSKHPESNNNFKAALNSSSCYSRIQMKDINIYELWLR